MEYQKVINPLDTTSDDIPKFIIKKWLKFMINLEKYTTPTSK